MLSIGFALSSEEQRPADLVRQAQRAEQAGFDFAMMSDHFHPWTSRQGQSSFVWTVLGAIAQATSRLRLGTGVTCPLIRMHPAIVAQAAATTAALLPGRFFLGVGAGENLNEHVTGARWPRAAERHEMLREAIAVMRRLWCGKTVSHRGRHYVVDEARLYTLPPEPPKIMVAAAAGASATLAGELGDGLVGIQPDRELIAQFTRAGGEGKPRIGQVTVCWAGSDARARQIAHEWWPTAALGGVLPWETKTPELFEAAVETVREDDVARSVVCSADPEVHREAVLRFARAGFDHVYVHQVGPEQERFLAFFEKDVLPAVHADAA